MYALYICRTCRDQKRVMDSLEQELQGLWNAMWVLGTKPRSPARAANTLSHQAASWPLRLLKASKNHYFISDMLAVSWCLVSYHQHHDSNNISNLACSFYGLWFSVRCRQVPPPGTLGCHGDDGWTVFSSAILMRRIYFHNHTFLCGGTDVKTCCPSLGLHVGTPQSMPLTLTWSPLWLQKCHHLAHLKAWSSLRTRFTRVLVVTSSPVCSRKAKSPATPLSD